MPHVRINLLEHKGARREISDPLSDDLWRGCGGLRPAARLRGFEETKSPFDGESLDGSRISEWAAPGEAPPSNPQLDGYIISSMDLASLPIPSTILSSSELEKFSLRVL